MTFDLISGLHMQIQTWHPPLWLCTHAKYYVKSGLTNVLKNANKTKNRHLFSIRIANYPGTLSECQTVLDPDQDRWFVGPDLGPNCLLFAMLPLARKEFNTHADVPIGK